MQGLTVRAMRPDDAVAVADLSGQLGYASSPEQMRDRLRLIGELRSGRVLVAQSREGDVIGWVHVLGVHLLESDAHAELGGLVVAESMRGHGVGRALVEAAEDWALEQGYATMRVRSNVARDRARRFYEQLGYDHIKTQNNFRKVLRPEA
jgi:GNAT superfamily N-acetyltransferase